MDYFDYSGAWDFDIEQFLEESQEQERRRIEKELERIQDQLKRREQIHQDAIDELESKRDWYISRLETLYQQSRGKTSGERNHLKERIAEFYEEIREEQRSLWRDRQELEQEQRQLRRELEELDSAEWLNRLL